MNSTLNPPKGTPIEIEACAIQAGDEVSANCGVTFRRVKRVSRRTERGLNRKVVIYFEGGDSTTYNENAILITKAD